MPNYGFNLDNFLNGLQELQSKQKSNKDFDHTRSLNYVNLSHPDNYGKYQILPMLSTATYTPYVYLFNTREVKLPHPKKPDSTTWYKILPDEAYNYMDENGKIVSSLTDPEKILLSELRGLFDKLVGYQQAKDITRVKNYTLFQGKCIGLYDKQNKIKRSNFNALFICTSRNIVSAVNDDISNQAITYGGNDFVSQIYTRQATGRTGWLIFSIDRAANGVGFDVKVVHNANIAPETIQPYDFTEEDLELYKDPVRTFLAWQSSEEGSRSPFNSEVLTELKFKMIDLITKYESAGNGVSTSFVSSVTTSQVQGQPTVQKPVDPMIPSPQVSQVPQGTLAADMNHISTMNNDPLRTPPVATIDPVSGIPVSPSAGYPINPNQQNMGAGNAVNPMMTAATQQQPQFQQIPTQQMPQYQAPSWAQPSDVGSQAFPSDPDTVNPFKQQR